MQWTKRYTSGQRIHFIYVFLFGFFIGVLLINLWTDVFIGNTGFLDEELLYQMKYARIDNDKFFDYVLKQRLLLFIGLAVGATTYLGLVMTYGALLWFGMAGGIFVAAAAVRYGFKGILLLAGIFLPQYIIYIPVFGALLNWCYYICCTMYFPARIYGGVDMQYRSKKTYVAANIGRVLVLFLVVIIGIWLESYVNPIFLAKLLKIF